MEQTAESRLHHKRDQFRIGIRKRQHNALLSRHRQEIIANLNSFGEQSRVEHRSLVKIYQMSKNTLAQFEQDRIIGQLVGHFSSESEACPHQEKLLFAIIGNLLVDPIQLENLEEIARLLLKRNRLNLQDSLYVSLQAFAFSGLFRCYDKLHEEFQSQLCQQLLPVLFAVLMHRVSSQQPDVEAQKDLLEALIHLFGCDELELYCRLNRYREVLPSIISYHVALQKLQTPEDTLTLQLSVLRLYRTIMRSGMHADKLFGQAEQQFADALLACLEGYDEMDHDKTLGDEALNTIEDLVDCHHSDGIFLRHPKLFQRVLKLWHPVHPRVLFKFALNYPKLLELPIEAVGMILSDLKDGCEYTSDRKIRHQFLEALFELLKYYIGKYGSAAPAMLRFQSIGGFQMLCRFEGQNQPPETEALIKDILDFIYLQDELAFQGRDHLLPE